MNKKGRGAPPKPPIYVVLTSVLAHITAVPVGTEIIISKIHQAPPSRRLHVLHMRFLSSAHAHIGIVHALGMHPAPICPTRRLGGTVTVPLGATLCLSAARDARSLGGARSCRRRGLAGWSDVLLLRNLK